MSNLNVNNIQPVGSGLTVTVNASQINASSSTVTAASFVGPLTATSGTLTGIDSVSTTNLSVNGNDYPSDGALSNRNILINGAMMVSQRNTSFTHTTSPQYTLDRFQASNGSSFNWNSAVISQSSDAPDGFSNSLKVDVASASTPSGGENGLLKYHVEAKDLQQLSFGSSGAKSFTLSFWVKSNKTGIYTVQIRHSDADKYLLSEYSISSSSTWEHKTLTFVGNTADVIDNDTGDGFEIRINLACGPSDHTTAKSTWTAGNGGTIYATSNQVNLFDDANNEWYITGVQLESGSVATPFEHRSYGDELARCQRYYQEAGCILFTSSPNRYAVNIMLPVTMRDEPTISLGAAESGTGGDMLALNASYGANKSRTQFYQSTDHSVYSNAWFKFDDEY